MADEIPVKRGRGRPPLPKVVKSELSLGSEKTQESKPEPAKPEPIESVHLSEKDKLDTLKSLVMSQQLKLIELEDKQKKICLTITNFISLLQSQFKGVFERFKVSW